MNTHTTRYPYVYLHITTKDPLGAIETHFEKRSDGRSWSNGDPRIPPKTNKQRGYYTWSSWKLESGVERVQPIDTHLRSLWRKVEPMKASMLSRPGHWKACLQFVAWFENKDEQLQFSAGHLTTAAYYRLETDFGFYYDDDFGLEADGSNAYWRW